MKRIVLMIVCAMVFGVSGSSAVFADAYKSKGDEKTAGGGEGVDKVNETDDLMKEKLVIKNADGTLYSDKFEATPTKVREVIVSKGPDGKTKEKILVKYDKKLNAWIVLEDVKSHSK